MPGTYAVSVRNEPDGAISVKCMDAPPSYHTIQSSFGSSFYKLLNLYYKANNLDQLQQQLQFTQYEVSGNISKTVLPIAIDPYQLQSTINIVLDKKGIILNGQVFYYLPVLAGETCYMVFDVVEFSPGNLLPKDNMFSNNDFFKDFSSNLILNV